MNTQVPTRFIPEADQGYVVVQLPVGAVLGRPDAIMKRATDIAPEKPRVTNAVALADFSGATFTNASNQGVIFTPFESVENREISGLTAGAIVGQPIGRMQSLREAFIIAIAPPAARGVGTGGGIEMQLQETESADMSCVLRSAYSVMGSVGQSDKVQQVFTAFSAG